LGSPRRRRSGRALPREAHAQETRAFPIEKGVLPTPEEEATAEEEATEEETKDQSE
jgi:hypothetical protein